MTATPGLSVQPELRAAEVGLQWFGWTKNLEVPQDATLSSDHDGGRTKRWDNATTAIELFKPLCLLIKTLLHLLSDTGKMSI